MKGFVVLAVTLALAGLAIARAGEPAAYHLSVSKALPDDPIGMQEFGRGQAGLVSDALAALPDGYQVDLLWEQVPVGPEPVVSRATVRAELARYRTDLTDQDTFVWYSHSHGVVPGLVVGPREVYTWADFAADILDLPARNVIVLVMSCHSGALADTLKGAAFRDRWADRRAEGRNFVVLTSVNAQQLSTATRIDGVRENPFTYAVRTAFEGQADGFLAGGGAGARDGRITLRELVDYIPYATRENSGQPGDPASKFDPQVAASFDETLVITPLAASTAGQAGALYVPLAMAR
jgi:hypothetical protein